MNPKDLTPERRAALIAAIAEMREADHTFLTVEGAEHFAGVFGVPVHCYVARANPDDPKGLTLASGAKSAKGVGAHEMAAQICRGLGVGFPIKMGRGTQLRVCCDALEAWLK